MFCYPKALLILMFFLVICISPTHCSAALGGILCSHKRSCWAWNKWPCDWVIGGLKKCLLSVQECWYLFVPSPCPGTREPFNWVEYFGWVSGPSISKDFRDWLRAWFCSGILVGSSAPLSTRLSLCSNRRGTGHSCISMSCGLGRTVSVKTLCHHIRPLSTLVSVHCLTSESSAALVEGRLSLASVDGESHH